jgi:hypothetical protein
MGMIGIRCEFTEADVAAVRNAVDRARERNDEFLLEREARNVTGPPPEFSQESFWLSLMCGLLTSRQPSTKGKPTDRFLNERPFPLSIEALYRTPDVRDYTGKVLKNYGGIRFTNNISDRVAVNLEWLSRFGWSTVEKTFNDLLQCRRSKPNFVHAISERAAANLIDEKLKGFGPKQSRNLWQELGLFRYEIPLDSRVAKWMNQNLSRKVESTKLVDLNYYESALDYLQTVCNAAGVLPCLFDAAAFDYENSSGSTIARTNKGTTIPGFVNRNRQITVRDTGLAGTDKFQRVYQIACSDCGHNYGANGSDIHDRKCPKCQGGAAGLDFLQEGAHA